MSTASVKTGSAFKLAQVDPEQYRQQTRKASWIIIVVFVSLAMLLSSLLVQFLGEPGGDNFRFNLAGVVAAVIISAGLVRSVFSKQPWMAANVYGWQLKRSLMSVTNVMHKVKEGVAAQQPTAMLLLRFYHLGVMQMHRLDGNTSEISLMVAEVDAHQQNMQALGLDTDQPELNPAWLQTIKNQ